MGHKLADHGDDSLLTGRAVELPGWRRLNPARRIVVFIAVLAFALQSYIAQTHIHDAWQTAEQAASNIVRLATQQSPAPDKSPFDHNRADCPFCQAVIHIGAIV